MALRHLRQQEDMIALPRALQIAWRRKKMNMVIKKRQNSNSRIVGLLGRASLEGFLIKCLPEGGGRSIQPRAVGPVRRLLL